MYLAEVDSLLTKRVAEDLIDHLEDVIFPALLNSLHMDMTAEAVMTWDACELNINLARVVEGGEVDHAVSVRLPLLELPLHHNLLVLFNALVDSDDVAVKHVERATRSWVRLGKVARPLTDLPLVGHAHEYDVSWHAINGLDFSLLGHLSPRKKEK